jgi:hypothetical protein
MRIFVSYARVDRPYCIQIAEVLDFHEVWYDQKLAGGKQWWKEIQRRIEWCEGLIYLMSSESLASDYCRKEFENALALGKHIFPVLIDKEAQVPEDISELQYIDFREGLTVEAVRDLLRAIYTTEHLDWNKKSSSSQETKPESDTSEKENQSDLTKAVRAMEVGQFELAIELIEALKERREKPVFIDLDKMLSEAREALSKDKLRRQMEQEYRDIFLLVQSPVTRNIGLDAFRKFRETYPDYDPDQIANILRESPPALTLRTRLNQVSARIPLLEWCEVPAGDVRIETVDKGGSTHVEGFLMARYPVTNMQYHLFLQAPNGYRDPSWWDYSPEARAWRASVNKIQASAYKGADRPRENVNWYDARAFCNWLGFILKAKITLPLLRQRQRAVMGDDDRGYPWGDVFDKRFCNTRESDTRMTTVVNRYPEGVGPYDIYDLAGNVWEWCLDTVPDEEANSENAFKVVVHGGAFLSPYTRAHVAHNLLVPPQIRYASIGFRVIALGD